MRSHDIKILDPLIQKGVNIKAKNHAGDTAWKILKPLLKFAEKSLIIENKIVNRDQQLVEIIESLGADINARDRDGKSVLDHSISESAVDFAKFFKK